MDISIVVAVSIAILIALIAFAVETVREFKRMDKNPRGYTGSDRLAGSAE